MTALEQNKNYLETENPLNVKHDKKKQDKQKKKILFDVHPPPAKL